tara:strand:- start:1034 stop:1261 length:228 start_codon:yes stop_codon:yes gene_type:complete
MWQNVLLKKWYPYCKKCNYAKDPNLSLGNKDYCKKCKAKTETGYSKNEKRVYFPLTPREVKSRERLGSLKEIDDT